MHLCPLAAPALNSVLGFMITHHQNSYAARLNTAARNDFVFITAQLCIPALAFPITCFLVTTSLFNPAITLRGKAQRSSAHSSHSPFPWCPFLPSFVLSLFLFCFLHFLTRARTLKVLFSHYDSIGMSVCLFFFYSFIFTDLTKQHQLLF